MPFAKRLKSWVRTLTKLTLLVLAYFWLGAGYKLVYAVTHDLSRYNTQLPLPYYPRHFLIESLMHQTWMFGPDFEDHLGELPSLGALVSANAQATLGTYCRRREEQLAALPARYPYSLFRETALEDAWTYSMGGSMLGLMGSQEQPTSLVAYAEKGTGDALRWRTVGLPNMGRPAELARRLADGYPDSGSAPLALLRVAQFEEQQGRRAESNALYQRLLVEHPHAQQAEDAADALYRQAVADGKVEEARGYKIRALRAAERSARLKYPGRALPAQNTVTILGFRLDLTGLDLQLGRVLPAREGLTVAMREADRVRSLTGLDPILKSRVRGLEQPLEKTRNELWVAELYEKLKVGVPGPPPRPHEYPVSGEVRFEGRPLSDVDVRIASTEGPGAGTRPEQILLGLGGITPYRARTDRNGRFTIPGVPAGTYQVRVFYPLRPAEAGSAAIVPTMDEKMAATQGRVEVKDGPVSLPPLEFRRAVETVTFGELFPEGSNLRVAWKEFPGAASYRVEVRVATDIFPARQFDRRVEEDKRDEFRREPILWHADAVKGTEAEFPLLLLATDSPAESRNAQYEYRVTALDGTGRPLSWSVPPLARFRLSTAAFGKLMELKPPNRRDNGRRRGRGRGLQRLRGLVQ